MAAKKRARWSFAIGLVITGLICHPVIADYSKNYHIATLCHRKRSEQLHKKIDGAVLTSDNESNLDCVITFQTDSVLQKFMLRFEQLQLDCNAYLDIYDGEYAFGTYKARYSCGNNERDAGPIFTSTTSVTLKYVTDGWVPVGNAFRLVLTAFKDTPLECRAFRCQNHLCIHEDLMCDGVDHCGDNSDESLPLPNCTDDGMAGTILGVGVGIFVVIVIGTFIACFVCVSGAAIFVYKRYYRRRPPLAALNSTPNYPFLPKVAEESACSAKTNSTALNSVSVFHSAAPPSAAPAATPPHSKQSSRSSTSSPIESARRSTPPVGQTSTLPRSKPANVSPVSYSPGGTTERNSHRQHADRIQCSTGKLVLSDDKMKTASLNRTTHRKPGGREKGEWLV